MSTCPRCGGNMPEGALYCRLCLLALYILHLLQRHHVGAENAITRKRLCQITGLKDRAVRRLIAERLRDLGEPVCARRGYYYPATDEDWNRLEWMYRSLAMTSYRRMANIKRRRAEMAGGQTVAPEVEWAAIVRSRLIA